MDEAKAPVARAQDDGLALSWEIERAWLDMVHEAYLQAAEYKRLGCELSEAFRQYVYQKPAPGPRADSTIKTIADPELHTRDNAQHSKLSTGKKRTHRTGNKSN